MPDASRLTLPLAPAAAPAWHGWSPVDAPEPDAPQGMYAPATDADVVVPLVASAPASQAELLAPAGGPDAAFAALHFGADAVYLGLKKFSARAEAENFTLDEVDEITAYAHSLRPRRRVFVTVNTLVRNDELRELVEDVAALADIGVDAIILQDLGVYHLLREHFPTLQRHASTQLAVHNRAGAATLKRLGFDRVVLARELTFEEVHDITEASGIETEVFVHGALCYAYSGLCLFSSQTLGRSGNRGKCAYSCRDSYEVNGAPLTLRDGSPVRRDPRTGFPFSMKDLALPDHMPALRAAGVSCFKVEGRKKSPLYVATTTDYYRKLLDGTLADDERPQLEADMQTVFSRPWTRLFVQSHKDKEVADRDTVGHRGRRIGTIEKVVAGPEPRLRFRTERPLEKHDGLQVDLPVLGKPFGFAVERLWAVAPGRREKRQETYRVPAGAVVEVALPRDHPELPDGAPVYCSSSQAVKLRYRHSRPKPGLYRTRRPIEVEVVLSADELNATARVVDRRGVEARATLPGPFPPAKDAAALELVARSTFERLGDTRLMLTDLTLRNDGGFFVPVSRLNGLRRQLVIGLEVVLERDRRGNVERVFSAVVPDTVCRGGVSPPTTAKGRGNPAPTKEADARSAIPLRWSLKVDRLSFLDALTADDLADVDEIVLDIARDHPTVLLDRLADWDRRLGKERIRLALPALTRAWEDKGLRHKIDSLRAAGWTKWEAANLSAWDYLGVDPLAPAAAGLDLATDWSVYVLNRLAAEAVTRMGVSRFALSPEDGLANMTPLFAEYGPRAVAIVYQDTPLFVAESCAYANLIGGCPGKANCSFDEMQMVSSYGERVTALDYHCRTIVLNQGPFCLSTRLKNLAAAGAKSLRADFVYRRYEPEEVRDVWRRLRAGKPIPGGHAANFDRGVL
jgi:putative protease